jgi:chemotaxis protein methyltransferase CheR
VTATNQVQIEEVEIELLLTGVAKLYGYDFRQYAHSSLLRRVRAVLRNEGLSTVSSLQERMFRDNTCMLRFVETMSVHTTTMFRDADVYLSLRREVVPILRTHPFVRIWVAGCSTGEEAYSLAILLEEEGLYERCRIYATDISNAVLERARKGICQIEAIREYTGAYQRAGGSGEFSNYYTADQKNAILRTSLGRNIIFSQHNLVCDRAFNEFHLILCRNVMIYFGHTLRARVHELFHDSLSTFGVLGVGKKESTKFTPCEAAYQEIGSGTRLYRRVR